MCYTKQFFAPKWVMIILAFLLIPSIWNVLKAQPNIRAIEYYIDNDPGYGNATQLTGFGVVNSTEIGVSIPTNNLTSGIHIVGMRCQDDSGVWSLDNKYIFLNPGISDVLASVPTLQNLEYYVDNDPGYGNATAIPFSVGTNVNTSISIPTNNLTSGIHIVGVRGQDANGVWSLDNKYIFLNPGVSEVLASIPALQSLEYYIDNDPGYGNATAIPFSAGNSVTTALTIQTDNLTSGLHIVGLRGKDANGVWSLDNKYIFLNPGASEELASIPNLQYLEYYLDTDPGYGKATSISITPGTSISQALSVPVLNLTNGTSHKIGIRGHDANGVWSLDALYSFTKTPDTAAIINPITLVGCSGSVAFKGKTYFTSTIAYDTTKLQSGQDSITIATIKVQNIVPVTKDTVLYGCNSLIYNNAVYNSTIVKHDTLRTVFGCDSVYINATINVRQLTPTVNTVTLDGCISVTYQGRNYLTSTIKRDTIRGYWGCDSVYNVANIIVYGITPERVTINLTECKSVTYNGINYTHSTIKYDTLRSISSCDSVYIVANITVNNCSDILVQNIVSSTDSISSLGTLSLSWQVKNIGENNTGTGWSENVYLKNNNGDSAFVGTVYYNHTLDTGSTVLRQANLVLPQALGINGSVYVVVKLVPGIGLFESVSAQNNNSAQSVSTVFIRSSLSLRPDLIALSEADTSLISCLISRNGSWGTNQTFRIVSGDASRLHVPDSVIIPAGSSGVIFYIKTIDNQAINADTSVAISISGDGYTTLNYNFPIVDDEMASLTLSSTKTTLVEGDTATLIIERQNSTASPLNVSIRCSQNNLFAFNQIATIPANQTSISVKFTAIDNTVPDLAKNATFTATAFRYNSATKVVTLNDNDIPDITLSIRPDTVSESAGYQAAIATIRRQGSTVNPVTVQLSDNSDRGDLYYSASTITFNAGESVKQVNVGINNNNSVDGNREAIVTAAVYIPDCNCNVAGIKGTANSTVTVLDDDVPSLKITITQNTLPEGVANAALLVIARNTPIQLPLTVTLASDRDSELVFVKTIVIPAGSASISVPISAISNLRSDGDRMVTFAANSSGFSKGICWALISDRTLPDAVVSITPYQNDSALAKGIKQTQLIVRNNGVSDFPSGSLVDLYVSNQAQIGGNKTYLTTFSTSRLLTSNSSDTVLLNLNTPNFVGQYYVFAEINAKGVVSELSYGNNVSQTVPLYLKPRYNIVSLQTNKHTYQQSDTVFFTGSAVGNDGASVANVPVEIYIINDDHRNALSVITDAVGNFKLGYVPLLGSVGHFIAGCSYPNMLLADEQLSFDIYGLKRTSNSNIVWNVIKNDTLSGEIEIINPGILLLSKLQVQLLTDTSVGFKLTFDSIADMTGGSKTKIKYTLIGTKVSSELKYLPINFKVTSIEGASLNLLGYFFCKSPKSDLKSSIASIQTTMTKGSSRNYQFTISNLGKGATGKVTISLPALPWMSLVSPAEIPSLAYGEHTDIVLRFSPDNNVPVSTVFNGNIAISTSDSLGIAVPFNIETVSTATGKLVIDVRDEYTYNTEAAPHLAGATIAVFKHFTNDTIAKGVTDVNGLFTVDTIVEGYYDVKVTAPNHDNYFNTILIDPGKTKNLIVNLSFNAITYNWNVVPTIVQDVYTVQTTVVFTTNVPAPVVEVQYPDSLPYANHIFKIVAINHGLIAANNVTVHLPVKEGMHFEILTDSIHSLGAKQSTEIWVRLTVDNPNATHYINSGVQYGYSGAYASVAGNVASPANVNNGARGSKNLDGPDGDCFSVVIPTSWEWFCGDNKEAGTCKLFNFGNCESVPSLSTPSDPQPTNSWPSMEGVPGFFSPTVSSSSSGQPIEQVSVEFCDTCLQKVWDALHCTESTNFKCIGTSIEYTKKLFNGELDAIEIVDGAMSVASCGAEVCEALAEAIIATGIGAPEGSIVLGACEAVGVFTTSYYCTRSVGDAITACWPKLSGQLGLLKSNNKFHTFGAEDVGNSNRSTPAFIAEYYNKLKIELKYETAQKNIFHEVFGTDVWFESKTADVSKLMNYIRGNYSNNRYVDTSDVNLAMLKPSNITHTEFITFIERYNNTNKVINGVSVTGDNYMRRSYLTQQSDSVLQTKDAANALGYASIKELMEEANANLKNNLTASSHSVCASVSLQFNQTFTMAREAFRGTLNIFNGHTTDSMKNIQLNLVIKDVNGNIAGADLFQVSTESTSKLNAVDGTGILKAKDTGSATILFIPTKYAAPSIPTKYSFGGTLSYLDPFSGTIVTKNLAPSIMTVNPSPDLTLTYFVQRDVLGDDPLTEDVVEPTVPAEFSLLINNKGIGSANNFTVVSDSPRIVDNKKGLLIDFNLVGSSLNGAPTTNEFRTLNFASIPGNSTKFIQWYFTSSLLGHFTDYDTKLTHVSSYSNPNLSLISDVSVHELIRSICVPNTLNSSLVGFMANDVVDANHFPDALYISDGSKVEVSKATSSSLIKVSDSSYTLNVVPSKSGWNYNSHIDSTQGKSALTSVIRQRDNAKMSLRNFWQTDRTLRDAFDPINEFRIHFVDSFSNIPETYLLVFEHQPDTVLEVTHFAGAPINVSDSQVHRISVAFNKAIDASTFTMNDLSLICQGKTIDISSATINKVTDTSFVIDLANTTLLDGFFVLGVQTSGIKDLDGYSGNLGKTISWTQYLSGDVALNVQVLPSALAGSVTPLSNRYHYGSNVVFSARPKEGYNFRNWTIDGNVYATDTSINYIASEDKLISANFVKKTCHVNVLYDSTMISVFGNVNGIYDYGSPFNFNVSIKQGYAFVGWKINGRDSSNQKSLSVLANSDLTIEAVTRQQNLPVISWSNPPTVNCMVILSDEQLNATASVAGTFVYSPSVATILQPGNNYSLVADFTPTDSVNNKKVSKTVYFTVAALNPIVHDTLVNNCNSVNYRGVTYSESTVRRDTIKSQKGCDSLYIVATIVVNKINPVTNEILLSECNSVSYKGINYTNSTIVRDTLRSVQGCDSIYNVATIQIKQPTTSILNQSICEGNSYAFNGSNYSTAGNYTVHLSNSEGCDSAVTLILTVKSLSTSTTNIGICAGESYAFNGTSYNSAGTYVAHLTNSVNCDSSATLVLTIKQPSTSNTTLNEVGSYTWNGTVYIASGTYTTHLINSEGCDSAATLILTITPAQNTWTGTVSTDWSNSANWSLGTVPTDSSNIVIPVTVRKPISSGTISVKDITIVVGESLANNGTLNVNGHFTNNGSFISGSNSTVVLKGTGNLNGTTSFRHLEVLGNYTVGANIVDKISVTGILKLTSGTLTTSNKLTLVSNASGSAMIQEAGGTLSGKAYVQHYTSGAYGFHHFSSPVSGATVSSWSNAFPITGANNATAWVSSKAGTLQSYNEVINTTSVLDSGYYNFTSLAGQLTAGKGFTAWLNSLPTLNTFGTPNTGIINFPVTHTVGSNAPRGWNFVGNPYPSPISWTALKSINTGLFGDASCYLWKSTGGKNGIWKAYDGTVGVNGSGDIINSSLGFFVYVNASGTLTFDNSIRRYNYLSPEIFGANSVENQIRVSVVDAVSGESDEAVAYTNSHVASFSRKMAQPLGATNPTIAFEVKGTKAAINVLKTIDAETELPLVVNTPVAGSYTLKFAADKTNLPVYLKDAFNGTLTDIKATGEVFISTTTVETANRFSLVFKAPKTDLTANYSVYAKSNSIVVTNAVVSGATIVVYNALGQQVARSIMSGTTQIIPVSSTSAHYVVKILDSKGANVVKQVVMK